MHLLLRACFFLVLLQHSAATKFPDCDDIKNECYSMEINPNGGHILVKVKPGADLNADNVAIVKIHAYNEKHYDIVLESLKPDIKKIEFKYKVDGTEVIMTCSKESSGVVFKIGADEFKQVAPTSALIRCERNHKTATSKIKSTSTSIVLIAHARIGAKATKSSFDNAEYFFFCDPKRFKFSSVKHKIKEQYKKVDMRFNEAFCGDEGSMGIYDHFEYRKDDKSEYTQYKKISCTLIADQSTDEAGVLTTKFIRKLELVPLKGTDKVHIDPDSSVDVRCVAKAKYFCNYEPPVPTPPASSTDVVNATRHKLIVTPPNKEAVPPTPTELACPPGVKWFLMNGKEPELAKNAKFECHNRGSGQLQWTYNGTPLTRDSAQAWCSPKLKCKPIPYDYLVSAFLSNGIPKCNMHGTLEIQEGSGEKVEVAEIDCNADDGNWQHRLVKEGTPAAWGGRTVEKYRIHCKYTTVEERQQQARDKIVESASIAAAVATVVSGIVCAIVLCFLNKRQRNRDEQRRQEDRLASQRYRRANDKKDESSGDKKDQDSKSNVDGPLSSNYTQRIGKGIFKLDNYSVVTLKAPDGPDYDRKVREALKNQKATKYSMETMPPDFKMVYDEAVRPNLEEIIASQKGIAELRKNIRAAKMIEIERMAKGGK